MTHANAGMMEEAAALVGFATPKSHGCLPSPLMTSPTLMKLQNAQTDPSYWYDQGATTCMGIADIFSDDMSAI